MRTAPLCNTFHIDVGPSNSNRLFLKTLNFLHSVVRWYGCSDVLPREEEEEEEEEEEGKKKIIYRNNIT